MSAEHNTEQLPPADANRRGWRRILRAGLYSAAGLKQALRCETAFRQEFFLGLGLLILSFFLGLPWWFKLLLNLLWLVLLAVELLNTAIEAVVDLVSPGYHPLAKQAKDFGSAAVFCLLLAWIVAWGSAFWLLAA